MIGILDYGAGNLFSLKNALDFLHIPSVITDSRETLDQCDKIIIPGVGAFPNAMEQINQMDLKGFLSAQAMKKKLLGICLGMQLLFETGFEMQKTAGLELIPGSVEIIPSFGLKIPHMGWNCLVKQQECPLLDGVEEDAFVYFVHSYYAKTPKQYIAAVADYGVQIPGVVMHANVFGCQFHPEKSGEAGLKILSNFAAL